MPATSDPKVTPSRGIRGSMGLALGALAVLAACGGKSSSPAAPNMSGAWVESLGGKDILFALTSPSGAYRSLLVVPDPTDVLAASNMTMYSMPIRVTASAMSGKGSIFVPSLPPGVPVAVPPSVTLAGTPGSTTFSATTTTSAGTSTDTFTPDSVNTSQIPLANLQGSYQASVGYASFAQATDTGVVGTLNLDARGNLTGTLATGAYQGTLKGTLTATSPGYNLYNASFTFTPQAPATPVTYTGLAYYRSTGTPSIILMTDNGAAQISGVFSLASVASSVEQASH